MFRLTQSYSSSETTVCPQHPMEAENPTSSVSHIQTDLAHSNGVLRHVPDKASPLDARKGPQNDYQASL